MTRTFLMISPYYPPMNFVGAKRALSLSRYLPARGWSPAVVALPAHLDRDPALEAWVPDVPMLRTYRSGPLAWWADRQARRAPDVPYGDNRAKTTGPRRKTPLDTVRHELSALPIDRFVKFLPFAAPGILRFLKKTGCELIHVNAGPFSAMYLGAALSKLTGLPLVLDLRDPWAVDPLYRDAWGVLGQRMADALEAAAFQQAGKVVLNCDSAAAAYRAAYAGRLPESHFARIRNHFDPALLDPLPPPPAADGPFRVVFFGHLHPLRNGRLFFEAYRRFIDAEGLEAGDTELLTLGERTPDDEAAIDALGLRSFVRSHPWVPVTASRALLGTADVLLDLTGPRHGLRLAGKLYDYLAARRPILSVSVNPEMDAILRETGAGVRVGHDAAAIAGALSDRLAAKRAGDPFTPDQAAVARFGAEPAADAMADIFDEVAQ